MSGKRLAVLAAAGQVGDSHHRSGPDGSPAPTLHPAHLRGGERPSPPLNLLLTSAVLGGLMAAVCAACYCCGKTARGKSRRPVTSASGHNTLSSRPVYTLPQECEHHSMCYDSGGYLPPYRRPPTPGPPPAYDSVVSRNDKLRHFGIEDDYTEDNEKQRHSYHDSLGPQELCSIMINSDSMSEMEMLKFCMSDGKSGIHKNVENYAIRLHCPKNSDRQRRSEDRTESASVQEEGGYTGDTNIREEREVLFTIASGETNESKRDGEEFCYQKRRFDDETDCGTSTDFEEARKHQEDARTTRSCYQELPESSSRLSEEENDPSGVLVDSTHHQELTEDLQANHGLHADDGRIVSRSGSDEALPTYEAAILSHKNYRVENA